MTGYLACNGHLKPIEEIICKQCKAAEEAAKKDVNECLKLSKT